MILIRNLNPNLLPRIDCWLLAAGVAYCRLKTDAADGGDGFPEWVLSQFLLVFFFEELKIIFFLNNFSSMCFRWNFYKNNSRAVLRTRTEAKNINQIEMKIKTWQKIIPMNEPNRNEIYIFFSENNLDIYPIKYTFYNKKLRWNETLGKLPDGQTVDRLTDRHMNVLVSLECISSVGKHQGICLEESQWKHVRISQRTHKIN